MVHNQPRPTLPGEVGPDPLNKHAYPKARLRKKLEMNPRPRGPGPEAGHLESSTLEDRETFADDRHVAFIEVTERRRRMLTTDSSMNQLSDVSSLLDCHLRYARQRPPVLIERSRVADHENFRMIGRGKIALNPHAAGAIGGNSQPLARRRR